MDDEYKNYPFHASFLFFFCLTLSIILPIYGESWKTAPIFASCLFPLCCFICLFFPSEPRNLLIRLAGTVVIGEIAIKYTAGNLSYSICSVQSGYYPSFSPISDRQSIDGMYHENVVCKSWVFNPLVSPIVYNYSSAYRARYHNAHFDQMSPLPFNNLSGLLELTFETSMANMDGQAFDILQLIRDF